MYTLADHLGICSFFLFRTVAVACKAEGVSFIEAGGAHTCLTPLPHQLGLQTPVSRASRQKDFPHA